MKKILLVCCLFICAVSASARPFVLGMYGVDKPEYLPLLKEAGFNCFQTYKTDPALLSELAQAAIQNDMQVLFYPNKVIGSPQEQAAKNWPVIAWYLVDEPDVARWSRERVIQAHNAARTAFPQTPTAIVIGQGKTRIPFYELSDILMMDWYPVPHLALTSFGDNVRWAKEGQIAAGVADHSLWGVVQLFDWREYKQYRPDNDRIGRFPTQEEIRFMSYDAIINGADGLFYFIFTEKGQPLPQAQPQYWARMEAVSKELAGLRPVFEDGEITQTPVAVSDPLAAQSRRYQKQLYTLLLNRSDAEVAVPKPFLKRKYKLLYGGEKTKQMPPYSVWVLQSKAR